ncbi:hypothetical protein AAY24_15780 [Sedimenticola thiotaurini]|uniref:Uncharacterized protein n=1 Tax=Sedimenticola thiotaurini TaxID=1543721 RepID=A0A0F7K3T5_9GAMM|nr:hypothetical protein AAY24_15780 [Sedimenticola thiotaurini]
MQRCIAGFFIQGWIYIAEHKDVRERIYPGMDLYRGAQDSRGEEVGRSPNCGICRSLLIRSGI